MPAAHGDVELALSPGAAPVTDGVLGKRKDPGGLPVADPVLEELKRLPPLLVRGEARG